MIVEVHMSSERSLFEICEHFYRFYHGCRYSSNDVFQTGFLNTPLVGQPVIPPQTHSGDYFGCSNSRVHLNALKKSTL